MYVFLVVWGHPSLDPLQARSVASLLWFVIGSKTTVSSSWILLCRTTQWISCFNSSGIDIVDAKPATTCVMPWGVKRTRNTRCLMDEMTQGSRTISLKDIVSTEIHPGLIVWRTYYRSFDQSKDVATLNRIKLRLLLRGLQKNLTISLTILGLFIGSAVMGWSTNGPLPPWAGGGSRHLVSWMAIIVFRAPEPMGGEERAMSWFNISGYAYVAGDTRKLWNRY